MKALFSLFLAVVATSAVAAGTEPAATPYDPAQPLDIARVISVSDTSDACGVVPSTMVYVDPQGQTHRVTYQVMGNCSGS